MKLSINETAAAQIQGLESKAFGFQLNAKMYDIVINKLYQNKAGAVLRELFANAWDSHVAANNIDTPIEIHMPSWLDQNFGIRDFGTGIPHDDFEDIYCNVGESTKEDSNEFIGAFGLGSKTPFTMTDTYIIENWHAGRKTTWLCFKSNGTPETSKVGDEPSDEPPGLQCSFSFDSQNTVSEFETELPKQLMFFPVKPKITGDSTSKVQWKEIPKYDPSDNYFFMEATSYSRYNVNHYIVMGNVSYPFKTGEVGLDSNYELRPMFESGKSLVLLADLGDVDIPPSREQLELTDKTKAFIKKRCEEVIQTYVKEFVRDMGTQATLLDARKYVLNANTRMVNAYMQKHHEDLVFLDGSRATWHDVQASSFKDSVYTIKQVMRRYKNVQRAYHLQTSALVNDKYEWYINDLGVGAVAHINNEHLKLFPTASVKTVLIVKAQDNYNKKTNAQAVSDCLKYIEKTYSVKVKLLSDVIGQPTTTVRTASKVEPDQIFVAKSYHDYHAGLRKFVDNYTETDFPTEGYFIEISGWQVIGGSSASLDVKQKLNAFLGRTNKKVYLVRTKSIKKLPKTVLPFSKLLEEMQEKALEDIERVKYINKIQKVVSKSYCNATKLLRYTFANSYKYRLLQRYIRNLLRFPVNLSEASHNYRLAFGKHYDPANHSTSTNVFLRDVPSGLEYLNHWYVHHAHYALESIEGYTYGAYKEKGIVQLQNLINPNNK